VINLARLLQSLDDTSDGTITVSDKMRAEASRLAKNGASLNQASFNVTTDNFGSFAVGDGVTVQNIVTEITTVGDQARQDMVTAAVAKAHFEETLSKRPYVGDWTLTTITEKITATNMAAGECVADVAGKINHLTLGANSFSLADPEDSSFSANGTMTPTVNGFSLDGAGTVASSGSEYSVTYTGSIVGGSAATFEGSLSWKVTSGSQYCNGQSTFKGVKGGSAETANNPDAGGSGTVKENRSATSGLNCSMKPNQELDNTCFLTGRVDCWSFTYQYVCE